METAILFQAGNYIQLREFHFVEFLSKVTILSYFLKLNTEVLFFHLFLCQLALFQFFKETLVSQSIVTITTLLRLSSVLLAVDVSCRLHRRHQRGNVVQKATDKQ